MTTGTLDERGTVEALARGFHAGQESEVGHTHVGRRGDLRMIQFHSRCHCIETAETAFRAIENLSPADRLAIAGITEDRLAAALHVTDIASLVFRGEESEHERDARAILAALQEQTP